MHARHDRRAHRFIAHAAGGVHSVVNESAQVSLSLHVYGKHVNHTDRSKFDPVQRTETIFKVKLK